MLKGDLATTSLVDVLRGLAVEAATGCLRVSDLEGEEALVYLKSGFVYSVSVPGRRPQLGARLVSSGALAPESLAEALEAQRDELQGWRLGELLVHLGFVEQNVVEAFVTEQLRDGITDLLRWTDGRWRFRKNDKTREDVAPPIAVEDLLVEVVTREDEWAGILQEVHAPTAVPVLSTRGTASPEMMLDGDSWSLLCKIDGERSIAELARDCGLTLFEAGRVVVSLVQQGLVDVEEVVEPALSVIAGPAAIPTVESVEADSDHPADTAMRVALAFTTTPAATPVDITPELLPETPEPEPEAEPEAEAEPAATEQPAAFDMSAIAALVTEAVQSQPAAVGGDSRDDLSMSIARVSAALSDLLGAPGAASGVDIFDVPAGLRKPKKTVVPTPKTRTPEDERRERLRAAAAAELAAAHAEAEAGRQGADSQPMADVVSLDKRRQHKAEEVDAEAARLAAEEAERLEAQRLEAQRLEAERLAAEEAARLEAERLEAERLEAERLAAEEVARLEAERLEAERLEAERLAAEEAARLEAERLEAAQTALAEQQAAIEAARIEAERLAAEAAEAERLAQAEAERLEAEQAQERKRENAAASTALTQLTADLVEVEEEFGEPEPEPDPEPDYPPSLPEHEQTDTASLLRELASLGLDDEPAPPAAARTATAGRPIQPPPPKKKKGLFGR